MHCEIGGTKGPRDQSVHETRSAEYTDVSETFQSTLVGEILYFRLYPKGNLLHWLTNISISVPANIYLLTFSWLKFSK